MNMWVSVLSTEIVLLFIQIYKLLICKVWEWWGNVIGNERKEASNQEGEIIFRKWVPTTNKNIFMKIKSIFFFKKIFRKIYFFRGEVLEAYSSRLPWVTQGAYIFVKKKWKENSKRKIALIIQRTQTFMLFSAQKNYKITKPQV